MCCTVSGLSESKHLLYDCNNFQLLILRKNSVIKYPYIYFIFGTYNLHFDQTNDGVTILFSMEDQCVFSNKYFNCCKNTSHKKLQVTRLSKLFFIELGKLIFLYEITDFNITINK